MLKNFLKPTSDNSLPGLKLFAILLVGMFVFLAMFGESIAPYDPMAIHYGADGRAKQLLAPNVDHWFGTTYYGRDVFSQILAGARVPLIVGVTAALVISVVGTNIGLIAGYWGGRVDGALMRLTDIAFGIPFLPFSVLLVALLQPSLFTLIVTISALLWRTTARVIRAQVLSLKERPFIKASRIAGASHSRIIFRHLLPNVLSFSMLYMALGVAWAVGAEASLSFLGFGDPTRISWGSILYEAYLTASIRQAWWTAVPAGTCISLLVLSAFVIGREFEVHGASKSRT